MLNLRAQRSAQAGLPSSIESERRFQAGLPVARPPMSAAAEHPLADPSNESTGENAPAGPSYIDVTGTGTSVQAGEPTAL